MFHHIDGTSYVTKRESKARFRQAILEQWSNRCAYCDDDLGRLATLDHVHPKVRGGLTSKENLVPACFACNVSKSAADWISWYRQQDFWAPHREDAILEWVTRLAA